MASKDQEWVVLQRKIFSRWCKQKLSRRPEVHVNDIVTDIADGNVLIALLEELSEKKFPGKRIPSPITMRIKAIENLTNALKFTWECGVQITLKPSAEQLADKDVSAVLGLVWGIMLRFIRIGDDDDSESLNARDALLLWVKNKCEGYPVVGAFDSFKKSAKSPFHNGIAMCAIIHKHRPNLLPQMATLDPANALKNIELAQEAAFQYFQLEKYITPLEVTKLDENSMVVYVAEFYYGIAEQRKIDLAGRRITKLIKLTVENDRLKAEYTKTAGEYKERLARVEATLGDRTIDDTMAGAKRRIELFYKYKTEDKNILLGNQLDLEANFNNLAMRLAHHKRPEFVPPEGASLKDVEAALAKLERAEQERSVALHAELNRQIRLAEIASQHATLFSGLKQWCTDKETFLNTHPVIDSVSGAQLQLRLLEAFVKEAAAARQTSLARLHAMGDELASERFEFIAAARAREADADALFAKLDELAKAREPVLQDDLTRETYKQTVRLLHKEYSEKYAAVVSGWIEPKRAYLSLFEESHSVADATTHLSLLDAYEDERAVSGARQLAELQALKTKIFEAHHESQWSTYDFEHTVTRDPVHEHHDPAARDLVATREAEVLAAWKELATLCARKRVVLDDHLAREQYSERTRIIAASHEDKFSQLDQWAGKSEAYLDSWPEVHSSNEARTQLSLLEAFDRELERTDSSRGAEFRAVNKELLGRKYESEMSSYTYEHTKSTLPPYVVEHPEQRTEAQSLLEKINANFATLRQKAAHKRRVLDDHKARELYAEATRVVADTLANKFVQLEQSIAKCEAYLNSWPEIHSSTEARAAMTQLKAFERELARTVDMHQAEFRAIGADLLARSYAGEFSSYIFECSKSTLPVFEVSLPEKRAEAERKLKHVEDKFAEIARLAAQKRRVVEDHLAREAYADETRVVAGTHADQYSQLHTWTDKAGTYLATWPEIRSSNEVRTQLTLLDGFDKELGRMAQIYVAEFRATGAELLGRKYQTELSSYVYERSTSTMPVFDVHLPEKRAETEQRLTEVDAKFVELVAAAKAKRAILDDHLARELYAEDTRMIADTHRDQHAKLAAWVALKEEYLAAREEVTSVAGATALLAALEAFEREKAVVQAGEVASLLSVGAQLLARKRETAESTYIFEHTTYKHPAFEASKPEERAAVTEREQWVAQKMETLSEASAAKKRVLDDHLARETEATRVRMLARQHEDSHGRLSRWFALKDAYLAARPAVTSVSEAKAQLTLLDRHAAEADGVIATSVASFAELGAKILAEKYLTPLSTYVFDHTVYSQPACDFDAPEAKAALEGRLTDVQARVKKIKEARVVLRTELDAALALELEKERLRLEYAHAAHEYTKWVRDAKASLAIEPFGFTLEEVRAHGQSIEKSTAQLRQHSSTDLAAIKAITTQMEAIKVGENAYTKIGAAELEDARATLDAAVESRNAAYAKELQRQIENDNLCKEFAGKADPFSHRIIEHKDAITASKADLEDQLKAVISELASLPAEEGALAAMRALAAKMEERGITNNRHTTLTLKDVEVQWQQYQKFLGAKKAMLESEIEHSKLRGVTQDQLREIEENFRRFDKDNSGDIDRKELTACLYSLGEERSSAETRAIIAQYGDAKTQHMTLAQFRELMLHILGDSDTRDEVVAGFGLIVRVAPESAPIAPLSNVCPESDVQYIERTAPKAPAGFNFVAWVDSMFSR